MFEDALYAAKRSHHYKFRVGAAIYDAQGKLLSIGWSHVSSEIMSSTPRSMHAEHHAIRRLVQPERAYHIVVAALNRNDNITCSKPCDACAALIIKRNLLVTYTDRME